MAAAQVFITLWAASLAVAAPHDPPTARPVYNFEYKVADDTAQTYISKNEARDGDDLSGTYSYVDANGGLVTVNYQAGLMGYSETREVQDGFVKMIAKPTQTKVDVDAVTIARDQAARLEAARLEASRLEAVRVEAARVEAARLDAARVEAARVEAARLDAARIEAARLEAARLEATRLETVSVDQSSLIAQVLATLQPLISQTVQEAISTSSTSSSSSSSSSTSLSSSSTSGSSVTTGDVSSTFGTNGLSVSVETPEFQYTF